jgi:hypothetical protein
MRFSSANTLIVVGGCLVMAPLAFLYFSYRLGAQVLSEAIAHETQWDKVNFHPMLPEYYVPACLILGALCIGIGVFLSWQARRERSESEPLSLNLS